MINFHKSTLVPIHVDPEDLNGMSAAPGCRVEGFPQTYPGLPLLMDKLKLTDFAPLIAKVDKYLSCWPAIFMSYVGRVVLLNAVLDAFPVYAMGAITLPPVLIPALDAIRRAFLCDLDGSVL